MRDVIIRMIAGEKHVVEHVLTDGNRNRETGVGAHKVEQGERGQRKPVTLVHQRT